MHLCWLGGACAGAALGLGYAVNLVYIGNMRRHEAIERLKQHRVRLGEMGVKHVYLFGSVARDAAAADSDIDIMVDLDEGPDGRKPLFSAFDIGGIQFEMARLFGKPVDLVVRSDAMGAGRKLEAVQGQLVDVF
jgi:predicted nucleotidyltransferase